MIKKAIFQYFADEHISNVNFTRNNNAVGNFVDTSVGNNSVMDKSVDNKSVDNNSVGDTVAESDSGADNNVDNSVDNKSVDSSADDSVVDPVESGADNDVDTSVGDRSVDNTADSGVDDSVKKDSSDSPIESVVDDSMKNSESVDTHVGDKSVDNRSDEGQDSDEVLIELSAIKNQNSVRPDHPALAELFDECINFTDCGLHKTALNMVFGSGDPNADIMLIGEAPGADEDESGLPFMGRAGKLLLGIFQKYGVERDSLYIANILKHRPPNNRNPIPAEIKAWTPFLKKQIDIVQPKLLITLGNFSSQFILQTKEGITKIRGSVKDSEYGKVMPSLHPSAIIRGVYPKELLERDIVTALRFVGMDVEMKDD